MRQPVDEDEAGDLSPCAILRQHPSNRPADETHTDTGTARALDAEEVRRALASNDAEQRARWGVLQIVPTGAKPSLGVVVVRLNEEADHGAARLARAACV